MPRQAQHPQLDLRQPAFGGAAEEEQARLGRGSQAHVPPANLSSGALAEQFNLHPHREDGRLSSAPGWLQKLLGPRRRSGGSSVASLSTTGTFMPLAEGVKPLAYQESNAPQAVSRQTPLEGGCSASTPDKLSGPKESFNEMENWQLYTRSTETDPFQRAPETLSAEITAMGANAFPTHCSPLAPRARNVGGGWVSPPWPKALPDPAA